MLVWRVEDRFRKEAVAGVVAYASTVNITAYWGSGNRHNSKVSEKPRDGAKGIPDFKLGCFTSTISACLRVLCVKLWIVRAAMNRKRFRFWEVCVQVGPDIGKVNSRSWDIGRKGDPFDSSWLVFI